MPDETINPETINPIAAALNAELNADDAHDADQDAKIEAQAAENAAQAAEIDALKQAEVADDKTIADLTARLEKLEQTPNPPAPGAPPAADPLPVPSTPTTPVDIGNDTPPTPETPPVTDVPSQTETLPSAELPVVVPVVPTAVSFPDKNPIVALPLPLPDMADNDFRQVGPQPKTYAMELDAPPITGGKSDDTGFFCAMPSEAFVVPAELDPRVQDAIYHDARESSRMRFDFLQTAYGGDGGGENENLVEIKGNGLVRVRIRDFAGNGYAFCGITGKAESKAAMPAANGMVDVRGFALAPGKPGHVTMQGQGRLNDGRWYMQVVSPKNKPVVQAGYDQGHDMCGGDWLAVAWRYNQVEVVGWAGGKLAVAATYNHEIGPTGGTTTQFCGRGGQHYTAANADNRGLLNDDAGFFAPGENRVEGRTAYAEDLPKFGRFGIAGGPLHRFDMWFDPAGPIVVAEQGLLQYQSPVFCQALPWMDAGELRVTAGIIEYHSGLRQPAKPWDTVFAAWGYGVSAKMPTEGDLSRLALPIAV